MALPPTIPTSFVPHAPASAQKKYTMDFIGAFSFVAYLIFAGVVVLAVGIFLYNRVLTNSKENKEKDLAAQEQAIDASLAQSFIRLHDKLESSKTLLANHVAFSNTFATIGALLPVTVRFNSIHVTYSDMGVAKLEGSGIAKSFNALAAASASLATGGQIKDAIFSHIAIAKDNSVTFSLSAILDQKITEFRLPATSSSTSASATDVSATTTP